jgi:hypothetical protein
VGCNDRADVHQRLERSIGIVHPDHAAIIIDPEVKRAALAVGLHCPDQVDSGWAEHSWQTPSEDRIDVELSHPAPVAVKGGNGSHPQPLGFGQDQGVLGQQPVNGYEMADSFFQGPRHVRSVQISRPHRRERNGCQDLIEARQIGKPCREQFGMVLVGGKPVGEPVLSRCRGL